MHQNQTSALDFLSRQREFISRHLNNWFTHEQARYEKIIPDMHYSFKRVLGFCQSGKMIRGALVLLLSKIHSKNFDQQWDKNALHLAAAMELFQSFLLIHDDIMDRDPIRRGQPAVYMQYAKDMEQHFRTNNENSIRLGEALGICVGDITNFLGYEMISSCSLPGELKAKLFSVVNYELTRVGLAQMQDVAWSGTRTSIPTTDAVLNMYINKTGRYTFTLPMILGANLGKATELELSNLYELGDILGILFQIRDDEIGIFGDEKITGKPVGSDIEEGKKTIFLSELFSRCNDQEHNTIMTILNNSNINKHQINSIIELMKTKGVLEFVQEQKSLYRQKAVSAINQLDTIEPMVRDLLLSLTDYCLLRTS
jgi:geranylgeranyl diphosphate synthase type I